MTLFELNEVEQARYKNFYKEHKNCASRMGAVGGFVSVTFTPTGLGNAIALKCNHCGRIEEITDIDNW